MDQARTLDGLRVVFVVSEPWEFGAAHPDVALSGTVVRVSDQLSQKNDRDLLVQLDTPIDFEGQRIEHLAVSARHQGSRLVDIADGADVSAGAIAVPPERALGPYPWDFSWWRGGGAFVGSIRRI